MYVEQRTQHDRDDTSFQLARVRTLGNLPLPCHENLQLFHRHAQLQFRLLSRFVRLACTAERPERLRPSVAMMLASP